MSSPVALHAVLFDMDGTLIDSEYLTDQAVMAALVRYAVDAKTRAAIDLSQFHGVAWHRIADTLRQQAPQLTAQVSSAELQVQFQDSFHQGLLTDDPRQVPGSVAAVHAAVAAHLAVAIVSSSDRASIDHVVARLDIEELLQERIAAEDCTRSKPDPQGYLLGAARLGVLPEHCLVFEDSVAGLQAARSAGMYTIAIAGSDDPAAHARLAPLADEVMTNFNSLSANFFTDASSAKADTSLARSPRAKVAT